MIDLEIVNRKFTDLKVCVIIPTYNNAGTLAGIIEDVARYTEHIIVVNDGSTDDTPQIVQSFPFVQFIKDKSLKPHKNNEEEICANS